MNKLSWELKKYFKYGQNPLIYINFLLGSYAMGVYWAKNNFGPGEHPFLLLGFTIVIALVGIWYKKWWGPVALLIFMLGLGMVRGGLALELPANNISHYYNQTGQLQGIIVEEPRIKIDNHQQLITYVVQSETLEQGKERVRIQGKVYFYCKADEGSYIGKIGDKIKAEGTVRRLRVYRNPGMVDGELRAHSQGIYSRFLAYNSKVVYKENKNFNLQQKAYEIRMELLNYFLKNLPEQRAYMLYGMIFGGYLGLNEETVEAFTGAGVVHMLAVSGAHIAILAGFIMLVGRLLALPSWGKLLLLALVLFGYGLLCGFRPSVVRAIIMGLLTVAALCVNRQSDGKHLLSMTALIMVLVQPLLIFNISFQLSFAATAALIYIMMPLSQLFRWLPKYLALPLALTTAVQLGTAPILAWYFNNISLGSFFSNLVVLPFLEICIILGMNLLWLCFIFPWLGDKFLVVINLLLGLANYLIINIAHLPYALIYIGTFSVGAFVAYYLIIYLLLKAKIRAYLGKIIKEHGIICTMVCILGLGYGLYYAQQPRPLAIHFIDVNQGDGALIITPHGHGVVIDTGGFLQRGNSKENTFDMGKRVIVPYLRHYGISKVDYLILSHAHMDHMGGAKGLISKIPVQQLIISQEDPKIYAKALGLKPNDPLIIKAVGAAYGQEFTLDGVKFTFVQPAADGQKRSGNAASNVLKLTYGNFVAIFTGDLEKEGEAELLARGLNLKATLLKVGHHGSDTSSTKEFVEAISPSYAVISCGVDNSFGHPKASTLTTLQAAKAKLYRTDQLGAVAFYTNGHNLQIKSYVPKTTSGYEGEKDGR